MLSDVTDAIVANATAAPRFQSQTAGYIALAVSSLCFGTNLVPVKKFRMGDGIGFQWLMCNGIMLVGVILNIVMYFTDGQVYYAPLGSLGGLFWASGNAMTVFIIECIGLSLGLALWSVTNMLLGFFTARFGAFSGKPELPSQPIMNYVGVAVAACSIILYASIKPSTKSDDDGEEGGQGSYDLKDTDVVEVNVETETFQEEKPKRKKCGCKGLSPSALPKVVTRILGVLLACLAGSLYGCSFGPIDVVVRGQDAVEGQTPLTPFDYVFAHMVGIWLTSTVIFVIYAIIKWNKPWFPDNLAIFPSIISGILWGIAQTAWFVSNDALGKSIAFPITTTCPMVIATFIGTFIYKEIRGLKNFIILGLATTFTITGVVLNAMSF